MSDSGATPVVYGIFDFGDGEGSQLIAAKKAEAQRRSTNVRMLATARTWGDVKQELDPDDFQQLCNDFRENFRKPFEEHNCDTPVEPPADTPFDRSFIRSEYGYDNWVVDPQADMTRWVPSEIQEYFGRLGPGGMFCDPQLSFDSRVETWIVNAFAKNGFKAERDDDLVWSTFNAPDDKNE